MKNTLEKIYMQSKVWKAIGLILILGACGGAKETTTSVAVEEKTYADQRLMSTLWIQQSGEAELLCRQGFAYAWIKLQENLKGYNGEGQLAIVVDIDETILDNSPYEARIILDNENYSSESWNDWVMEASAPLVPGAKDFLMKASELGAVVYYVSNRKVSQLDATIQNLERYNLPFADPDHVFLKSEDSDKTERRERIKFNNTVLLYVGDQLTDFSEELKVVEQETFEYSTELLEQTMKYFIILPNPMYGGWESNLYQNRPGMTNEQKNEVRLRSLNPQYKPKK